MNDNGTKKTFLLSKEKLPEVKAKLTQDPLVCTGCAICELACSMKKDGVYSRALARLKVHSRYYEGQWSGTGIFVKDFCRQCSVPECFYACPVEDAMYVDEKTGARVVDEEKCIGCRRCEKACPWNMIVYIPDKGVCSKCDLCGGDPECVKQCPASGNGAIGYVEL
jgi:Fe-S-cluster-containing dehydrogenase component